MGRPKKGKEPGDWFTTKQFQANSNHFELMKKEYGEEKALLLREKLFDEEVVHILSRGSYRNWLIAYQWLVKLAWNPNHTIPEKKSIIDALQPQGLLLQKCYKMALQCLDFGKSLNLSQRNKQLLQYETAVQWVQIIVKEHLADALVDALASKLGLGESDQLNGNVKEGLVAIERKRLALIKKAYEYVLDSSLEDDFPVEADQLLDQEFREMNALKELLAYSMILATPSNPFRDEYWKPFLKQYSAWIAKMSSPAWQTVMLKSDNKGNLTEWQHNQNNSQVCIGDLTALKQAFFIRHTQQGFTGFPESFSGSPNPDYNPRKISIIAPKYF